MYVLVQMIESSFSALFINKSNEGCMSVFSSTSPSFLEARAPLANLRF